MYIVSILERRRLHYTISPITVEIYLKRFFLHIFTMDRIRVTINIEYGISNYHSLLSSNFMSIILKLSRCRS